MKNLRNIMIGLVIFIVVLILTLCGTYYYNIAAVSKNDNNIMITIPSGTTTGNIGKILKEHKLIKSTTFFKLYLKLNDTDPLKAGTYRLNQTMNVKKIINILSGNSSIKAVDTITLKEGKSITDLATIIETKTDYKASEFLTLMNDDTYIKTLISNYWFLSNDILDTNIYYPLEGYLFPNTYDITNLTLKQITKLLLDETDVILTKYKTLITASKHSVHELLTLASMVELEGNNAANRGLIAGVFYNRLRDRIPLGSDVTAYYAAKKNITEDITTVELASSNPYNTRSASGNLGLPIGPICNPGEEAINAAINPTSTTYMYFVADTNGKIYFTKTYAEHLAKISELESEGSW